MDFEIFPAPFGMLSPDKIQDFIVGKSPSRTGDEEGKYGEFLVAQVDRLSVQMHFESGRIDDEALDLAQTDGLPKKIVRSRFEAFDALLGIVAFGNDQDGGLVKTGLGPDKATEIQAGPDRKGEEEVRDSSSKSQGILLVGRQG